MNILVLNGSPRGEKSVTLQYVAYLQNKFPAHTFNIVQVGQRIKDSMLLPFQCVLGAE